MNNPAGLQLTDDSLFAGRLTCRQYADGYRFSVDAVLAAHFCRPEPRGRVLDLGSGNGIISLILAYRHPQIEVTGLEVQEELVALAGDNASCSNLASRVSFIHGCLCDIGGFISPESYDLVVVNPPYRQTGRGRISPSGQRARARHEIDATLDQIVAAAAFAVKNRGRVVFIYPAVRAISLINALKSRRLEPKRLQPVYSYPESAEAALVLVEAVKNGGEEVQLLAPFFIYTQRDGSYTVQMQDMYR